MTTSLRMGAYGRWSGFAETTQMVAVSREGMAFGINGQREPARYGTRRHITRGEVPALALEGPLFRHVIAPEVALLASPANAWTIHLGVGHKLRSGLFLWARSERESVAPQDALRAIPLLPTGNRVAHGIASGVSLKP